MSRHNHDVKSICRKTDMPEDAPKVKGSYLDMGFPGHSSRSPAGEQTDTAARRMPLGVLVTTAGGTERDLIKCLGPMCIGDFTLVWQRPGQVFADATIVFPFLVAETFAAHADEKTTDEEKE